MKLFWIIFILFIDRRVKATCYSGRSKFLEGDYLTCHEAQEILDYHNKQRNTVANGGDGQPKAANMREMKWNKDLQKIAQAYSNRCEFKHSHRPGMGENIAIMQESAKKKASAAYLAEMWYKEIKQYSYEGESKGVVGHYTQMVWANSDEVGCGLTFYFDRSKRVYTTLLVCNYKPPGNVMGQKPYVKGERSCSSHNLKDSADYEGLCSKTGEKYDICEAGDAALGTVLTPCPYLNIITLILLRIWYF